MKPTKLDQELEKILKDSIYVEWDMVSKEDIENIPKEITKDILSLLQTTIRESLPEEKSPMDDYEWDIKIGYNQAIRTITSNLQKAGLL
jgi:hypothetical protein